MSDARLRHLATAEQGLRWMRTCHRRDPQLDATRAVDGLRQAEAILRAQPEVAHRHEDRASVREWKIAGSAFSLLYAVARRVVWITDLLDRLGAEASRTFVAALWMRLEE
jgi:hypothetical protein